MTPRRPDVSGEEEGEEEGEGGGKALPSLRADRPVSRAYDARDIGIGVWPGFLPRVRCYDAGQC